MDGSISAPTTGGTVPMLRLRTEAGPDDGVSGDVASGDGAVVQARAESLSVDPIVVRMLQSRGIVEEERQRRFLDPRLADLRVPSTMAGFQSALDLLLQAWRGGWRIGVFGDYDVDGVTTTTILTTYLEAIGLQVVARVATREGGYGFGIADAKALHEAGVQAVLTGDCGTSDHDALAWLRERGISTGVIDHHQVPEIMPPTDALLNPHQPGCEFPFKGLCSAGVAFYLCAALRTAIARETGAKPPDPRAWLDLVALGTVCDMVPMVDENRILVRHGLRIMEHRLRPGVRALLDASGVGRTELLDEGHLGFKLGPRLNAPGRLGPAEPALELLRARSHAEARAMAARVESCNARRRTHQDTIVREALQMLAADPMAPARKGIVVACEGWLHGIVGIAANGVVERYRRPALVVAIDTATGEARGSARTHGDIDVRAALHDCAHLLRRYGGHRAAAGVSLDAGRVPELIEAFDEAVARQCAERGNLLEPHEVFDGELPLAAIDGHLLDQLDQLAPYGVGFPAPKFLCSGAEVTRSRLLKDRHLSMTLRQGGATVDAIAFNHVQPDTAANSGSAGPSVPSKGDRVGCLFVPTRNHFRGRVRLQLMVERVWRLG